MFELFEKNKIRVSFSIKKRVYDSTINWQSENVSFAKHVHLTFDLHSCSKTPLFILILSSNLCLLCSLLFYNFFWTSSFLKKELDMKKRKQVKYIKKNANSYL